MKVRSARRRKTGTFRTQARHAELQRAVLAWYARSGRSFPWRTNRTPYRVIVAELMLQQTQADRVVAYFQRFLTRFPSFASLARASRGDVLTLWSGLGYNRRAIYLHEMAKVVTDRFHGRFPRDLDTIQSLPGIGPYTARAVIAFSFNEPTHASDVNIDRIVGRVSAKDTRGSEAFEKVFGAITHSADLHDAMMDIGATICTARMARCDACPLQAHCRSAGRVQIAPKAKRTSKGSLSAATPRRLVRGAIVRHLVEQQRATQQELERVAVAVFPELSPAEVEDALTSLVREQLVVSVGRQFSLPGQGMVQ